MQLEHEFGVEHMQLERVFVEHAFVTAKSEEMVDETEKKLSESAHWR